jgi:glutamate synthase domain-containing protein 2
LDRDVISPPFHKECTSPAALVEFIARVQDISELPVGIKMCFGREEEFRTMIRAMKARDRFPDYISIDGAEGGTGAAPKSFMDDLGVALFDALPIVTGVLREEGVRNRLKLLCAGKLISPARQIMAMSLGADACYTARGFMLALGCIQALQCNRNTCPVGITTQNKHLQVGLDIAAKSVRVANYVDQLVHDHEELMASLGCRATRDLGPHNLHAPLLDLARYAA